MRFSPRSCYAIAAMADLASHDKNLKPISLADIAVRQRISLSYLQQLFTRLRRSGLVTGVQGRGGGYRLVLPAEQISVADIMLAVDGDECNSNNRFHSGSRSATRITTHVTDDLWAELVRRTLAFYASVSLAHLGGAHAEDDPA